MGDKISIIIPTKNEEKVIGKTLKKYSDLKKYLNLEIIVSDGNSTDKTIEIARKYADRVVLAKKGEAQTIARGRNAGARVSKGKYLFHTDADVFPENPKLFFSEVLNAFRDKNVVAVTTKLRIYPNEERVADKIGHFFINLFIKKFSFLGKGECQIVTKKSFEEIGGYHDGLVMGEDFNLFRLLRRKGKIKYLDNLCVYHSPRRFREQGYFGLLWLFLFEGLHMFIWRKSFLKEWKPIR